MMNSISTIFTMDIFRHFKPETGDQQLVGIGRIMAVASITIAMLIAKPLLGNFKQAFQFIQEFTGFFTPGIVVLFLLGMFWKQTTAGGALAAALGSFVLSLAARLFWPELPFMDRVGLVFLACMALAAVISLRRRETHPNAIELGEVSFATSSGFNVSAAGIAVILAALYSIWW